MSDYDSNVCPRFDCLPARLHVKMVALVTGFAESDIPILVERGLLKPLGKPAPNAPKYFARVEIELFCQDVDALNQATRSVSQYWKKKRERRTNDPDEPAG